MDLKILNDKKGLPNAVKINGAVSPAMRDIPSNTLVMMPLKAQGNTTRKIVVEYGTPSDKAASLYVTGTIFRVSSVPLMIMGSIMIDSAVAPAMPEKLFMGATSHRYANI